MNENVQQFCKIWIGMYLFWTIAEKYDFLHMVLETDDNRKYDAIIDNIQVAAT